MQAILGLEGVAETQIIKQPDVLMLAYLLPEVISPARPRRQLRLLRRPHRPCVRLVARSGHRGHPGGSPGTSRGQRTNTSCGPRGPTSGTCWGNTADGIHGASAGGLWQALVFGFGGVRFSGDEVLTAPRLPAHWTRLAFRITHRGRVIDVDLRPGSTVASPGAFDLAA